LAVHPPIIPAEALAADVLPPVIGAAHNFARPDGQATLRLGSTLRVRLSREIEGVWYPRACGWLGTLLILDCQVPATDSVSAEPVWKEIGRDGAAALRCGPSIGRARDVSVPFFPRRPGLYVLRARIYTYALPTPVADDAAPPSAEDMLSGEFGVVARDVVHIKVRVIWWNGELIPEDAEPVEEMPKENLAGVVE
jgi:hypothetical protein